MRKLLVLFALLIAACDTEGRAPVLVDGSDGGTNNTEDGGTQGPPTTTANPKGRSQVGPLAITLTSDRAATITYTMDGSDPTTSETAESGPSPVVIALVPPNKVTLRFFAKDDAGKAETPKSETYELLQETAPASITGSIVVHPLLKTATGQVGVQLFTADPVRNPNAPTAGFTSFAASSPSGLNYKFEGLSAGRYWAAAYYWSGDINEKPELISLARQNPLVLDPAVPEMQRADFIDLYLGQCDPEGTGVDGEVVVAPHLQNHVVAVAAYRNALNIDNLGDPSAGSLAPGTGERRPFAICNVDPGNVNLIAAVSQRDDNNPTDIIAAAANPISVSVLSHTTLYLGAPSPGLSSISGQLNLSGPLPGGVVTVMVSTTPFSRQATLVGAATVLTTSAQTYSFSVTGLPTGKYYVAAFTRDSDGSDAMTERKAALTLQNTATPGIADFDIAVGRLVGTIEVNGAPAGTSETAVLVYAAGSSDPVTYATATLGVPDGNGIQRATYKAFGLANGAFAAAALVKFPTDSSWEAAYQNTHYAPGPGHPPPQFTIMNGGSATVNFSRVFP